MSPALLLMVSDHLYRDPAVNSLPDTLVQFILSQNYWLYISISSATYTAIPVAPQVCVLMNLTYPPAQELSWLGCLCHWHVLHQEAMRNSAYLPYSFTTETEMSHPKGEAIASKHGGKPQKNKAMYLHHPAWGTWTHSHLPACPVREAQHPVSTPDSSGQQTPLLPL